MQHTGSGSVRKRGLGNQFIGEQVVKFRDQHVPDYSVTISSRRASLNLRIVSLRAVRYYTRTDCLPEFQWVPCQANVNIGERSFSSGKCCTTAAMSPLWTAICQYASVRIVFCLPLLLCAK